MVPRALLLALLAGLVAAPLAAAQPLPTDVNPEVTLTVTPTSSTVNPGASTTYQLSIGFSFDNAVMCTGAGAAEVAIGFADKPSSVPGLTGTLSATRVVFDISPQAGPVPSYAGDAQTVQFNVTAAPNVTPNHDHAFNFTATFDGTISGCQALSPNGIGSHTVSREATLRTGGGTGTTGPGTGTGTDSNGAGTGSETEAAPHLGVAGLALALAFVARRKMK